MSDEVTTDPVLDMTIMQNRIDELQEQVDEQEYFITALQDNHRITLMNHLLPYTLPNFRQTGDAVKEAREIADETVTLMAEAMNAKAAEYRKRVEAQREEAKAQRVVIENDETTEN